MAVIEIEATTGGMGHHPFRHAVGELLARLYSSVSGRALLEAIGAWHPERDDRIVIRRAVRMSAPASTGNSLDRLLGAAPGGSSIGHVTVRRQLHEVDTASAEERAWRAARGRTPTPAPSTSRRASSMTVPVNLDPGSGSRQDGELLHELVHALRTLQSKAAAARLDTSVAGYDNREEFNAVLFENVWRSEKGLVLRKGYGPGTMDPAFDGLESRISQRRGRLAGGLRGEFDTFSEPPTVTDIEWLCERFVSDHHRHLLILRNESSDLFNRFAQIAGHTAAFNPLHVFNTRRHVRSPARR